jgi:hypothetical protein
MRAVGQAAVFVALVGLVAAFTIVSVFIAIDASLVVATTTHDTFDGLNADDCEACVDFLLAVC